MSTAAFRSYEMNSRDLFETIRNIDAGSSVIPAKAGIQVNSPFWIPALASFRQLGRNDVRVMLRQP
jgi:hypothetical protein